MSEAAEKFTAPIGQPDVGQDFERLLVAAADTILRLVAERNALRSQAVAHEQELKLFRRQFALILDSYRTLTTEFVSQLQQVDAAATNVVQGATEVGDTRAPQRENASNEQSSDPRFSSL
jgi:hypothetical protein